METIGAAAIICISARTIPRDLLGPLPPIGFFAFAGTLFLLCVLYSLISYADLSRGIGRSGERFADAILRLGIGTFSIIVASSIVDPYAWRQDAAWWTIPIWGLAGSGLSAIVVNQWQLEISALQKSADPRVASAARNHGLTLLVSSGAASTLTLLGFLSPGLLPAPLFIVALWCIAGLSLFCVLCLQSEDVLGRAAVLARRAALSACAGIIVASSLYSMFAWPPEMSWGRIGAFASLVIPALVTLSQLLEAVKEVNARRSVPVQTATTGAVVPLEPRGHP